MARQAYKMNKGSNVDKRFEVNVTRGSTGTLKQPATEGRNTTLYVNSQDIGCQQGKIQTPVGSEFTLHTKVKSMDINSAANMSSP
jgi:hypothetical protein